MEFMDTVRPFRATRQPSFVKRSLPRGYHFPRPNVNPHNLDLFVAYVPDPDVQVGTSHLPHRKHPALRFDSQPHPSRPRTPFFNPFGWLASPRRFVLHLASPRSTGRMFSEPMRSLKLSPDHDLPSPRKNPAYKPSPPCSSSSSNFHASRCDPFLLRIFCPTTSSSRCSPVRRLLSTHLYMTSLLS